MYIEQLDSKFYYEVLTVLFCSHNFEQYIGPLFLSLFLDAIVRQDI